MPERNLKGGERLRKLREKRGLTLRDVEKLSSKLARTRRDPRLRVPKSRLSEIETKGRTPSIYCLYALSLGYDTDIRELMRFYGIPF